MTEYEDSTVGSLSNEEHDALAEFGIIKPRPEKTKFGIALGFLKRELRRAREELRYYTNERYLDSVKVREESLVGAIAILAKAEQEPELEYFHGYLPNGTGATLCISEDVAKHRVVERGGYVLSRPKTEPFTVVDFKV